MGGLWGAKAKNIRRDLILAFKDMFSVRPHSLSYMWHRTEGMDWQISQKVEFYRREEKMIQALLWLILQPFITEIRVYVHGIHCNSMYTVLCRLSVFLWRLSGSLFSTTFVCLSFPLKKVWFQLPCCFGGDCRKGVGGGLLKDTFFQFKILFIEKLSKWVEIHTKWPQRTKFQYIIGILS